MIELMLDLIFVKSIHELEYLCVRFFSGKSFCLLVSLDRWICIHYHFARHCKVVLI